MSPGCHQWEIPLLVQDQSYFQDQPLRPLFSAVMTVCRHSLPLVRLYGLQTLESWFNCLNVMISPLSLIDSLAGATQID